MRWNFDKSNRIPNIGTENTRRNSEALQVKRKKPKQDDYYEESPGILGVGSYCLWRENIKKPKKVKIEGFIRKEDGRNRRIK
jgi:predicted secreted protein